MKMKKFLIGIISIIFVPIIALFVYGFILGFTHGDMTIDEIVQKYWYEPLEKIRSTIK